MFQVSTSVGMNRPLFMDYWYQSPDKLFQILVGVKQTFECNSVAVEHFASLAKVLQ